MKPQDAELFRASLEGDATGVIDAIARGANPNAIDPGDANWGGFLVNYSPLMVAAASPRSNPPTVKALLQAGADVHQVSAGGVTAGWYAAGGALGYKCDPEADGLPPDHPHRDWGGGDVDRLRLILDAGARASECADNGISAVCAAATVGDSARLALLLERGADLRPEEATGTSACDVMPWVADLEGLLAEAGIDFDVSGIQPFTVPLFQAAKSGSTECVRLILDAGFPANFEIRIENALHHASTLEIAKMLWDAGARPLSKGWMDPVDEAFEGGNLTIAEFFFLQKPEGLERQRYLQEKLLRVSGVNMNPDAIRLLLRLGARADEVSTDYGSPLHSACWQGDGNNGRENEVVRETIETLTKAGADVQLNLRDWGTPLHQAVSGDWESPTSVWVLLEHGAEVDAVNDEGKTPLMLAIDGGALACVRLLLAAGADPEKRDRRRKTAKDHAQATLKTWQSIVKKPPGISFPFMPPQEEMAEMHREKLEEVQEIVRLLGA